MTFFDGAGVLAMTSTAAIDFTPADFNAPLSGDQQKYLKDQTGQDISQVFWRRQVHGSDVVVASSLDQCRRTGDADAFVTAERKLPLAIRTADCVPVFLFDPVKQVTGIAHAGWKGTHQEIVVKTIETMTDKFGCRCYDMQISLGPSIRRCCYEVGPEFKGMFAADIEERGGRLYCDTALANLRQLVQAGVPKDNIFLSPDCTGCNLNYHSYRRQGEAAGRMISLIMLL
jgi:polyphenol oxidase